MTRALILLLVVGCTELPEIEDGACGNGVIDRDEDCDGGAGCVQCRRICETDAQCGELGGSYRCGADNICHAPSGVFEQTPAAEFSFVVGRGDVADLDGDRIGDVVGFSDITIDVRFGDLESRLGARATQLLPYSNTEIALRMFDRDRGVSDLLVPTPDGLAAYSGTASKSLVAYPFANAPGGRAACATNMGTGVPVASFTIASRYIGFVVRASSGTVSVTVLDLFAETCATSSACGLTAPDPNDETMPPLRWEHYETTSTQITSIIALSIPDSLLQAKVCALRFNETGNALTRLTPAPIVAFAGPVALARPVSANPCPALYTGRTTPTGINYYASTGATAADCGFTTTPVQLLDQGKYMQPAGRIPLLPGITGQGPDALVVLGGGGLVQTTDIYSLQGAEATPIYHSPRPLFPTRWGDLDGDGSIEAVATVNGRGAQGEPDLDVLYRSGATFVPYRIATQSVPTHLELGDFDGNQLVDIAYTERVGVDERLMIAYGTRDRPLPPAEIAKFENIVTLNVIDVNDSIDPLGGVLDDLMVVDEPDENMPRLAILHGNPQRSMLAYYDPRGPVATVDGSTFFAAVAGDFIPASPANDVVMFHAGTDEAGSEVVNIWLASGTDGEQGLSNQAASTTVDGITAACNPMATLCTNGAEYLRWPIAGRDIVLAIDGFGKAQRNIVTIATNTNGDGTGVVMTAFDPGPLLQAFAFVFAAFGGDVDRDGLPNLVVSVGGPPVLDGGAIADDVLDCRVGGDGVVESCASLAGEIDQLRTEGWTCRGAVHGMVSAAGRHDPAPISDDNVAVLCTNGGIGRVFRIEGATGALTVVPLVGSTGVIDYQILAIGDIDGDTLLDLIGVSFDPMSDTPVVHVHRQCDAVDVACRDGNPVEGTP